MKVKRKIIEIDEKLCNGCGQCVLACAEQAIAIIDGKAKVVSDKYCDGLGACLGECPEGALQIIEREAAEFDEKAVAAQLERVQKEENKKTEDRPMQCPSARIESFVPEPSSPDKSKTSVGPDAQSTLTHWPIQIRLVPPHAPFLQNADLLIASDCTAFSYPAFQRDFVAGRAILIGCPKLDDQELYMQKFTEIFSQANLKSVTVVEMEVPCCHGMPLIVKAGMDEAGKKIPLEIVTVGVRGKIIKRVKEAA